MARALSSRPTLSSAASLLLLGCDVPRPTDPIGDHEPPLAAATSTYFPPAETKGGWRKTTESSRVRDMGLDAAKLQELGRYLMSLPHENYSTGVSGYKPSHKAAIVVKDGWIVGEYYNQSGADKALYYTASNGKTIAMMLTGALAQTYPQLGLGPSSKLYDKRWLPEGFPLSDSRKAGITLDQVFRHTSGIIPQDHHPIADGAVQTESGWQFASFTIGKNSKWPQSAKLSYTPNQPSSYSKDNTYSSVAFNHFSLMFENVSGKEASVYLRHAMLDRIGAGKTAYKVTSGMGNVRFAAAGNVLMGARDFMRVGYLMLNEGAWGGQRIFAASWLRRFTQSTAYRNLRSNRDCYWGVDYPADLYRTTGSGQNWVLVVPSLDLLLTFNGRTPASKRPEIDRRSLELLFAAVKERYVACDGTVKGAASP
jgi:Beta-lactamase